MSVSANQMLVRRLFDAVWNQGNEARLDELLALSPDRSIHTSLHLDATYIRTNIRMLRAAFPDWHVTIEEMIGMPDRVLARWYAEGTHLGSFMGLAPTGRRVTASGISIFYIAEGRIQDARVSRDSLNMLRQVWTALDSDRTSRACATQGAARTVPEDGYGEAIALGSG